MADFPIVRRPEDDPLYQSVRQPPDPAWKMRNNAIGRVVNKMLAEPSTIPIPGPKMNTPQNVNEFRSQQEPAVAGPIVFSPKNYYEKRSEDALDSYSKSKLGTSDQQYETMKEAGQFMTDMITPAPGAEFGVVPKMVKDARRLAEFKSGRAPVKTLSGPAEEVANRIAKRGMDYHASSPESIDKIIDTGAIMPDSLIPQSAKYKASREAAAKKAEAYKTGKGLEFQQTKIPSKLEEAKAILAEHSKLAENYNKESDAFKEYMKTHENFEGWEHPIEFLQNNDYDHGIQAMGTELKAANQALNDWYDKHDEKDLLKTVKQESIKSKQWNTQKGSGWEFGKGQIKDIKHDPSDSYATGRADDGKYYSYELISHKNDDGTTSYSYNKTWPSQSGKDHTEVKQKLIKWLKGFEEGGVDSDVGVSTSRIPRVSSKATKAVSMQIDPSKMPSVRPFAESDYGKTTVPNPYFMHKPDLDVLLVNHLSPEELKQYDENSKIWKSYNNQGMNSTLDAANAFHVKKSLEELANTRWLSQRSKDRPMNKRFEFENRTFGKPIDFGAVNQMLIDRTAMGPKRVEPWYPGDEGLTYSDAWKKYSTPEEKEKWTSLFRPNLETNFSDPAWKHGTPEYEARLQQSRDFYDNVMSRILKEREKIVDPAQQYADKLRSRLGPDFPISIYDSGKEMHRHRVEQFRGQNEALKGKTVSPLREHEKRISDQLLKKVEKMK